MARTASIVLGGAESSSVDSNGSEMDDVAFTVARVEQIRSKLTVLERRTIPHTS